MSRSAANSQTAKVVNLAIWRLEQGVRSVERWLAEPHPNWPPEVFRELEDELERVRGLLEEARWEKEGSA